MVNPCHEVNCLARVRILYNYVPQPIGANGTRCVVKRQSTAAAIVSYDAEKVPVASMGSAVRVKAGSNLVLKNSMYYNEDRS